MQNKLHNLLFSLLFVFGGFLGFGQSELDSLEQKSYGELLAIFDTETDLKKRIKSMDAWIKKAKSENNRKKIVAGYYNSSQLYNDITRLKYCDSIIVLTTANSYTYFPTLAYLSKAYFYHEKGDLKKAIDNYLLANKYARKNDNTDMIISSNYSVGTLKRKIGEYEGALKLYRENLSYAKRILKGNNNNSSSHYLTSLIAISNIFYELKSLDSASYYNNFGIDESLRFNNVSAYHHFAVNEGIVNYLKGNFDIAIDSIKKHNIYFREINDIGNLSYTYFYLGKTYDVKNETIEAINFFKKVDSIFQLEKDVSPHIREGYENLINYYKQNNDLKSQLFYINRLIKFDSVINSNNLYLGKKIFKEYDIPKLIAEKQSILDQMKSREKKNKLIIYLISSLLLLSIGVLIIQYRKRKLDQRRFERIINGMESTKIFSKINSDNNINIPLDIMESILSHLDNFEKNHEFISNKVSLNYLSKKLNTNSNYLSKIINHSKKSSFTNYIYNLRINYAIDQMQKNPLFKKYTIKAIAQEVGFNNAETFSKAFYKSTGIKPSYFMKELEKLEGGGKVLSIKC